MRNWLIAAVFFCAVLAAPAALAADKHGVESSHQSKRAGVETGLFVGAIETTLWTIVVFLVLFGVLRAFAWKPILEGLDKREQTIARDKEEANKARQEAEKMRQELAGEKAKANAEIRSMMDKARSDAEALAGQREAQMKAELTAERERQRREIDLERETARKEVFDQGARLAALLSAKTIKRQLTYEDHHALLDEALNEFRASAEARKHDLENATA